LASYVPGFPVQLARTWIFVVFPSLTISFGRTPSSGVRPCCRIVIVAVHVSPARMS
jgi:hypothetical protein